MSTQESPASLMESALGVDPKQLTKTAINRVRTGFAVSGIVALLMGILLIFWPDKTSFALTIILGITFVVTGVVRVGIGIFTSGIDGGTRALNIIVGILMVLAGVITLKYPADTTEGLLIFIGIFIGIAWIAEGILMLTELNDVPSKGWTIFAAIISILAGIAVLSVPDWSVLWLMILSGITLVVLGIMGIVRAFTFGKDALKALS